MSIKPVNPVLDRIFSSALRSVVYNETIVPEYTSEGVPESGKAIHAMWLSSKERGTPFRVLNSANEGHLLYFSEGTNLLYRFIHDLDHAVAYEVGRGTTRYEDERYLNCLMARRVYLHAIKSHDSLTALAAFFAVYHDTVGQVKFYKEHGTFLVNQRAHTVQLLNECTGMHFVKHGMLRPAYQVMINYLNECGV